MNQLHPVETIERKLTETDDGIGLLRSYSLSVTGNDNGQMPTQTRRKLHLSFGIILVGTWNDLNFPGVVDFH